MASVVKVKGMGSNVYYLLNFSIRKFEFVLGLEGNRFYGNIGV
jgi:hypothetical protein